MRYTVVAGLHLSRLRPGMKVLLTLFCASVLLGLVTSALKYTQRAEFSRDGARRYYRGDPATGAAEDPFAELGVVEERPAGAPLVLHERKSVAFLVDVTHPHAFTVPVLLFILFHLLALTRLREWQRIVLHCYGFGSFAAAFGSPWLLLWHPGFAAAFLVSGVNLFFCFALVIAILLWETWCVRVPARRGASGDPDVD